jgi:periplasmic protein TonB
MVPGCGHGGGRAGLPGGASPLPARLALAVGVSVALHAALVFGLHPAGAPHGKQLASLMTARLLPLSSVDPLSDPSGAVDAPAQQPPADNAEAKSATATAPHPASVPGDIDAPMPAERAGWLDVPLPAPRYYLASELDRSPVPLQPVEPESPAEAGATEGAVVLRVRIDERGGIDDVAVVRAQPQNLFDKAAVAAFDRARFSPGIRHAVPVKSQILVEVQFRNPDRIASGRSY